MIAEQQYYQAKTFLTTLRDAHSTLDEIAANRASIQKYQAYEKFLLTSIQNAEVHLEGNSLREGTYFNDSRIRKLGLFSKNLFSTKFPHFQSIRTYGELSKILESYL